jgi:hypothetical protein
MTPARSTALPKPQDKLSVGTVQYDFNLSSGLSKGAIAKQSTTF